MINTAIVIIGDEILLGRVTDTNSGAIARAMDRAGSRVVSIATVGDDATAIRNAVEAALDSADVVFTTGGLGPTKDDITKRVLTDIFGGETVRNHEVTKNIERIFAGKGLKLNPLTLDQALVPSSATIIQNVLGTAPIMVFNKDGKTLVSMPGVPFETEGMLPEVVRHIIAILRPGTGLRHSTIVLTGISESALAARLDAFEQTLSEDYKLAYLPDSPVIRLRLDGPEADTRYDEFADSLKNILLGIPELTVLGYGEKTIGELVVERLKEKGLTMSTAESCTGGNIAHLITAIPGASDIFAGGVVSYANSAKINVLGVGSETLATNGAVSRPVVLQMVDGACRALSTDCAVATSGIAGPGGGTPDKPVGTVWIAIKTPAGSEATCYRFPGNRDRVIARASATGLINLLKALA